MKIETTKLQELFQVMEEKNFSITEVIALMQRKNQAVEAKPLTKEFDLTVDYSRTVQEMINVGNYSWTNIDITEKHFPFPAELSGKRVSMSTKLFYFDRSISSKDVIAEMDKAHYRPGTLAELLALGEKNPGLQKEFPIVALGSIWHDVNDYRNVSVLNFGNNGRKLNLIWFKNNWLGYYRFLSVHK